MRPYQREGVDSVRQGWSQGRRRLILQAATGLGKTVIGVNVAAEDLAQGERCLWLAHRNELIAQPKATFDLWAPDLATGIVKAARREWLRDVVLGSVQSIRGRRLDEMPRMDMIIVDECHHALRTNTYGAIVARAEEANPDVRILGLTATPRRTDEQGLGGLFPDPAGGWGIEWGVEHRYLVPIRQLHIDTGQSLKGVRRRGGDFVAADLALAANTFRRNEVVLDVYFEHAAGRQAIVFTADVAHAQALSAMFMERGVEARALWGEMDGAGRAEALAQFQAGRIQVLTNCAILTEGTDLPCVRCLMMARPTTSTVLYEQMLGRGLRLLGGGWDESVAAGKTDCLVIDLVDVSEMRLVTAIDLSVPLIDHGTGEAIAPATPLPAKDREEEGGEADAGPLEWHAREVDPFTGAIRWEFVAGSQILDVGGGMIVVVWRDAGAGDEIPVHHAMLARTRERTCDLLTWTPLPYGEAVAIAEDCARRCAVDVRYINKSVWWDREPAGDMQADALRRFGFRREAVLANWSRGYARRVLKWCQARMCWQTWDARGAAPSVATLARYAAAFEIRDSGRRARRAA